MFAANPIAQEGKVTMSNQQANDLADDRYDLERLWTEHLNGGFVIKDVEATLETMVEDAYVNHMPVNTGGRGKDQLRRFYRHDFIPSWPSDLQMTPLNRVLGTNQIVDELQVLSLT